jgi:hypothetical protein
MTCWPRLSFGTMASARGVRVGVHGLARGGRVFRWRDGQVDLNLVAGVGVVDLELAKASGAGQLENGRMQLPDVPVHGLVITDIMFSSQRSTVPPSAPPSAPDYRRLERFQRRESEPESASLNLR